MRAKNEFKFIAEAYDTKLLLERIVDGTLMCPEACCGSPVMECKCGPDCPHCNCHEIQKLAAKEEDNEDIFPNSPYGDHLRRAAKQQAQEDKEDKEDKEVPERTKLLIQLVADGYVRLHKGIENEETGKKEDHYQVLAPWMGDTSFPILKAQGWKEVPFPSIRLTLNDPGTASVQLRPPYTDIQRYLDLGYKVVEDYVKATQSEDDEENEDENLEVTSGDTSPKGFMDEVEHTEDAEDRDRRHHPHYGEPEYDEERSERFRDDGPEDRKAPVSTKSIENQDETKRRMKQLGWEDNETRAQKAKRRREEKQRYDLHGNVLKHVKGPHDIYKK